MVLIKEKKKERGEEQESRGAGEQGGRGAGEQGRNEWTGKKERAKEGISTLYSL